MQPITLLSGLEAKSASSRLLAAVKLHVRAWAKPELTQSWLELLNAHPQLSDIARAQPRLLHKIYRPYLSTRLHAGQRFDALADHYHFVLRHGLAPLVTAASKAAVPMASIEGKSGTLYYLSLRAVVPMEREGEMVLQLHAGEALVQSVAFSFVLDRGVDSVAIGCLQGAHCGQGLDLARLATRDLYGSRPKHLLVRLVQQLGHEFGCKQMLMVGNHNRSVQKQMRDGRVHADYDSFWLELGASRRADGDFSLLCAALQEPKLDTMASSKRSEARKRFAFLSQLSEQLARQISLPQPALAA